MKTIITTFLLLIFLGVNSQEVELKIIKSKVFANEKYKSTLLFAKEDSNGDIFLVRNYFKYNASPIGYFIEHYNKELELLKREKIEINRSELRNLYINDSEVILLQFKYLQKEKRYGFITLTSKKDEFVFVENEIYSIKREKINKYDYYGIRKEIEFNPFKNFKFGEIIESDDNNFIAINLFIKDKNNLDSFLIVVFNEKFEILYEHTLDKINTENNTKAPLLVYQNMKLDNKGNIYILGKVYKANSKKEKAKGEPNYKYELFKINQQGQKQISFNQSDFFIEKLHLIIKDNNPYCVGLYSIKTHGNIIIPKSYSKEGIVRINIDGSSGEILLNSYQPFPENVFNNSFGKELYWGVSSENIKIKKSLINSNEDIIIFTEEFSMNASTRNDHISYFYGDIISFKINKEGDLIWANNINKKQKIGNIYKMPYASFAEFNKNNNYYYFFNAYEAEQLENKQIFFNYKKSDNNLYLITINESGKRDYKKLDNDTLKNIILEVRFGVLLNEHSLLFEATSNDKPLIVKITI